MPFHAIIKDGQLYFPTMKAAIAWQGWCEQNEGARVAIDEDKPSRSQSQNAYYWLYLGIVERETGQPADDVHEWAKRKLLPARFITVNGEDLRIPGSTTKLDKGGMADYLDKIAAATGIALPDPEAAGFISNTAPAVRRA